MTKCDACDGGFLCVACYLDRADRMRLEDDWLETMEGYASSAPKTFSGRRVAIEQDRELD